MIALTELADVSRLAGTIVVVVGWALALVSWRWVRAKQ